MERRELLFKKGPEFLVGAAALALGIRPEAGKRKIDIPSQNLFESCDCTPASIFQNLDFPAEAALSPAAMSGPDTPSYWENLDMPQDMLSKEDLGKAHIRTVRSKGEATPTDLILRRGIFDNQLFTDARDGILDEVVIVLVDHYNISWNASERLPEEAKLVFQAGRYMPGEQEALIDKWVVQWENYVKSLEKNPSSAASLESARRELAKVRKQQVPALTQAQISDMKNYRGPTGFHVPTNWTFGEKTLAWEKSIDPQSPRLKRVKELLANHPEVLNKVYLFVSVSGDFSTAYPGQSAPAPSLFRENKDADPQEGGYRFRHPFYPGLILRHEMLHYDRKGPLSEYETDTKTQKSIADAWQKFVESGYTDTTGYPFMLINKNGITITMNQNAPAQYINI